MKHPLTSEMPLLSSLYFCILHSIVHMYITFLPLYTNKPSAFVSYVYSSFSADDSIHLLSVPCFLNICTLHVHHTNTKVVPSLCLLQECWLLSAGPGASQWSGSAARTTSAAIPCYPSRVIDYLCWVALGTLQSTTKQTSPETNDSERKGFYPHGLTWLITWFLLTYCQCSQNCWALRGLH